MGRHHQNRERRNPREVDVRRHDGIGPDVEVHTIDARRVARRQHVLLDGRLLLRSYSRARLRLNRGAGLLRGILLCLRRSAGRLILLGGTLCLTLSLGLRRLLQGRLPLRRLRLAGFAALALLAALAGSGAIGVDLAGGGAFIFLRALCRALATTRALFLALGGLALFCSGALGGLALFSGALSGR